jgi:hypothetical protein
VRKSGSIEVLSLDGKELSKLSFANALITQVGFPALDAGVSGSAAALTVSFAPEYTHRLNGSNSVVATQEKAGQAKWLPSNFRLDFPGMDTSKVRKIDAFVIKQKIVDSPVGERRVTGQMSQFEIPNLVFTLTEAGAADWYAWHESFVIKGNSQDGQEKSGTLTFLNVDQRPLFKLTLSHVGIMRAEPTKMQAGIDAVREVQVELYVEAIDFDVDPSTGF